MRTPAIGLALSFVFASSIPACTTKTSPPCEALELEVYGCDLIRGGSTCAFPADRARTLRLWIAPQEGAEVRFDSGSGWFTRTATPADGGLRVEMILEPKATTLKVRATSGDRCRAATLELAELETASEILRELEAPRRSEETPEAEFSRKLAVLSKVPARERGRALGKLARIERWARGPKDAAIRFREAIELHRAAGDATLEMRDRMMLARVLITDLAQFREARSVLEDPIFERTPDGWMQTTAAQQEAMLARHAGDARTSLRWIEAAEKTAAHLELLDLSRDSKQFAATALLMIGRAQEAVALLEEVLKQTPADEKPRVRAVLLGNIAWAKIIARESATAPDANIEQLLKTALELYRTQASDPAQEQNILVNLALAAVQENRWTEATRYLEQASRASPTSAPYIALWKLDIEGRVALAQKRAREALGRYERMEQLAVSAASPSAQWRAALGRGQAFEAMGRLNDAAFAYLAAETMLERQSLQVPIGEGRDHFIGGRAESARLAIDVLLRLGRDAEAVEVARRARVRPLVTLQRSSLLEGLSPRARAAWEQSMALYRGERDALDREAEKDWDLPNDRLAEAVARRKARQTKIDAALEEAFSVLAQADRARTGNALAQPQEGELFLIYHPLRDGYAGFALSTSGVVAKRLGALPSAAAESSADAFAATLLEPFAAELLRATRVRIMAAGPAREVDYHALPFRGALLLDRVPVGYALDFPVTASTTVSSSIARALVVADPAGDLSSAAAEANGVRAALGRRGWSVEPLLRDDASAANVRAGLIRAQLFHYAGHGTYGGFDGFESALPLAGQSRLTVADILALPNVPELVALAGCETARSSAQAQGDSLGLAHAFLSAGSRGVIASPRLVDDAVAASFVDELYRSEVSADVAAAVREAQLRLRSRSPNADWAAFRALIR